MTKTEKNQNAGAYLEITMKINDSDRAAAAAVYAQFKGPFLNGINGALSKELLLRTEDVQVIHGFTSPLEAEAYLKTDLFAKDIVNALKPFLQEAPDLKVFTVVNA